MLINTLRTNFQKNTKPRLCLSSVIKSSSTNASTIEFNCGTSQVFIMSHSKGQDKNECITKIFCKDAHGAIILYDSTKENGIDEWVFFFKEYSTIKWKNSLDSNSTFFDGSSLPIMLIENKIDLIDNYIEDKNEEFVVKYNYITKFGVSAKTGINVNSSLEYLILCIIDKLSKISESSLESRNNNNINLETSKLKQTPEKSKCC